MLLDNSAVLDPHGMATTIPAQDTGCWQHCSASLHVVIPSVDQLGASTAADLLRSTPYCCSAGVSCVWVTCKHAANTSAYSATNSVRRRLSGAGAEPDSIRLHNSDRCAGC